VTALGSIFEPEAEDGPRGRDLRHEVTVPAWVAGHEPGYRVDVPLQLPALGGYVDRAVSAHDPDTSIHFTLPPGFPSGGALRLRGQGEPVPGGRSGDLHLVVHLDPSQATPPGGWSPLTWPTGQVLANSPAAPRALVVLVVAAFAIGAVIVLAL
jgi:hypothetical protein